MRSSLLVHLCALVSLTSCDSDAEVKGDAAAEVDEPKAPKISPETTARLADQEEAMASLRALYNAAASKPAEEWPDACPTLEGTAELITFSGAGRILGAQPDPIDATERAFEPDYMLGFGTVERGYDLHAGHTSAKTLLAAKYVAVLRLTKAVQPQIVDDDGNPIPDAEAFFQGGEGRFKGGRYDAWTYLFERDTAKPLCVLKTQAVSSPHVERKAQSNISALTDDLRDSLLDTVTKGLGDAGLQLGPASLPEQNP